MLTPLRPINIVVMDVLSLAQVAVLLVLEVVLFFVEINVLTIVLVDVRHLVKDHVLFFAETNVLIIVQAVALHLVKENVSLTVAINVLVIVLANVLLLVKANVHLVVARNARNLVPFQALIEQVIPGIAPAVA